MRHFGALPLQAQYGALKATKVRRALDIQSIKFTTNQETKAVSHKDAPVVSDIILTLRRHRSRYVQRKSLRGEVLRIK